ncbi:MAG: S-adenosylmethionine decarboxylase [Myxococcales bacterium]
MLGWHWILDARDCDRGALRDREIVRTAITGLPAALGLTRVGEPQLFTHEDPEGGTVLAGMTLIAESHFSLHARPEHGGLHADLFSCKRFDPAEARAFLQRLFRFGTCDEQLLERGGAR